VSAIQRIGILTGGGDCPGLNAVIRAAVKTAINRYGWEVIGIEDGFEGLILPGKTRLLALADVRGILPRGGTILGTTNRADPFHYEVEVDGKVEVRDMSDVVMSRVAALGLDALVVIGGDGSLRITNELIAKGLRAVGVPKTIDNDLEGTSVTFGFDTAVNTAMDALDRLHTTAESHHRVMILEVMGRDTGWIALHAGIASGTDVILIPEIPYGIAAVAAKVRERNQRGARFSIVVVAEGARPIGGEAVYLAERERGGMRRLGGAGEMVAAQLKAEMDVEVRVTVLGHLQRGGSPTADDRLLGTCFGVYAVQTLAESQFDCMVAVQDDRLVTVPLAEAVGRQKFVPSDGYEIVTARAMGICLGC
jgi:6-phosphofructokinase 1